MRKTADTIPTSPLAIMARRHAFHPHDVTSFAWRCATTSLVRGDRLSDPGDVMILDRLECDQALIELALKLGARRQRGNPGQQHFVLCTHVTDLAFDFARLFAQEVLLVFDKNKEQAASRHKQGEE